MWSQITTWRLREVRIVVPGHMVSGARIWTEIFLTPKPILPFLEHIPAETYCSFQNMSEVGVSVDANELNLFTHSKSALVYFECKMSTGIFNV